MTDKATPRPWRTTTPLYQQGQIGIETDGGKWIGEVGDPADARLIVSAVNEREEVIQFLQLAVGAFAQMTNRAEPRGTLAYNMSEKTRRLLARMEAGS